MLRREALWTLAVPSILACAPAPAADPPLDARLERAKTLDDYHPWTPVTDLAAWRERAQRVRDQVLVAAGLWPMPPAEPLDPVIHGRIDRGDYTVERVFFRSYPGFYVTGSLYRPKGESKEPRPAVLSPHGHWPNGRFFERSDADARREIEKGAEVTLAGGKYPLQARCAMLARLGCVVFHYDMVGNADSKQIGHAQGFRDAEAGLRLQSAFGLQTYNSVRAFDFLAGLPGVDPKRIAVTGASGGGTQTFFLCAIDDRPAVAFPAVMVSTAMQGGCVCENAPLLRVGTGNIEFAALMAPRPLGMTGANDWTLEIEKKGLPELKALYGAFGVPDLVDAKCYPHFDHNYNQVSRERMYAWFNRHLKLGHPEPVEERPFEPIPPAELSVFDAEHPRPADAADAAALRQTLTAISERQMAAIAPRDAASLAEHRRIVGAALRAVVVSGLPAPGSVRDAGEAAASTGAQGQRKLVLQRAGSADRVPALLAMPKEWKGAVAVIVSEAGKGAVLGGAEGGAPPGGLAGLARAALERGAAVLAPDAFLVGEARRGDTGPQVDSRRHVDYFGYTFGYNRTPLANRVHDVLTAIAYARDLPGAKAIHLVGLGEGCLWALLARALAGDAVRATIAERPSFDFADAKDPSDLRFLPGGLKYGGWGAFAAVSAPADLWLAGKREPPAVLAAAYRAAGAEGRLRRVESASSLAEVLGEILR
ncbi:MAG: acetylxylan esterase [Planctomycetes bacterium]|nr:acetylxylan esterase [Planctomycetota bacterium]